MSWRSIFDLAKKRKELIKLEKDSQKPDFWENKKTAIKVIEDIAILKQEIKKYLKFNKEIDDLEELLALFDKDEKEEQEIERKIISLEKKINKEKLLIFLTGKYDKGNAILSIYSGAGGIDAQDWTAILLRMYQRYCEKKKYQFKILAQSFGEGKGADKRIGIKSVTLEIKGRYAYGFLKKEMGVHRLVRISPFSSQKLRHTSFALVEVLPDIDKKTEKEITPQSKDLKIETFRASGPGGQHVNKRDSAIRITHIVSGITVSCQSERLQGLNREKAMKLLCAKIYQLKVQQKNKEITKIKGLPVSIGWGNQIRTYVFHPYQMIKDHQTHYQTSDVQGVLDGGLDEIIEKRLKKYDKI